MPAVKRPPITDPYVDARYIAERFSVSYRTALRWIDKLTREELPATQRVFKKITRPKRVRRVQLALLEEHLQELMN